MLDQLLGTHGCLRRVVGQPSSKTDFVVVGDNAGPSKLAALKKHGIKTLDEDGFLNLVATRKGSGKADEKTRKKAEKEQEEIKKAAKEMSKREEKAKAEGDRFCRRHCLLSPRLISRLPALQWIYLHSYGRRDMLPNH